MSDRSYPIPRPESGDDPRFTIGLTLDVARVLEQHGFPKVEGGLDWVELQQSLFGFIYEKPEVPQ